MFCGLGKEERTRFRKKRKGNKKPHFGRESRLVELKRHSKTHNRVNYFAVLKPFSYEMSFYTNFLGSFWVLKPKSRDLLPRNLVQTYKLII